MRIFQKHGMTNVGYWVPQDAPAKDNTLIYIISHESREAAKKSWAAFGADPEWKKVATESQMNGTIVAGVASVFMDADRLLADEVGAAGASGSGRQVIGAMHESSSDDYAFAVGCVALPVAGDASAAGAAAGQRSALHRRVDGAGRQGRRRRAGASSKPVRGRRGTATTTASCSTPNRGACAPAGAARRSRNTRRRQRVHSAERRTLARRRAEGRISFRSTFGSAARRSGCQDDGRGIQQEEIRSSDVRVRSSQKGLSWIAQYVCSRI